MKIAIYPGTFDPITMGHLDLIKRGLQIFDHIIVAVAINPKKKPLFSLEKRLELIKESTKLFPNEMISIDALSGLVVDYASKKGSVAIIRGLRAVSDFEFELQMALMNRRLNQQIETVFMMPSEEYSYLTSTIVKEVAFFGGSIKGLVHETVEKELKEIFK
ncbi:MAG: pantetheine-phosphate adenylyltransferase [Thermodesulfovibrionales bacterium]|nr:pantetheine-phosphate adenylyltransferase [Thermodesulfovibrionales bacterium]